MDRNTAVKTLKKKNKKMTNFTEGRLQAYEHMMRDTGKKVCSPEETFSGKTFS